MTASFVAYVDESGDEGFKFLPNEQGSSRWFVLSALVIRKENDLQVDRYLRLMAKTIYRHKERADGYGLKFWCAEDDDMARVLRAAEEGRRAP